MFTDIRNVHVSIFRTEPIFFCYNGCTSDPSMSNNKWITFRLLFFEIYKSRAFYHNLAYFLLDFFCM